MTFSVYRIPLEYTEAGLNGFPEDRLPKEFDTDAYQVAELVHDRCPEMLHDNLYALGNVRLVQLGQREAFHVYSMKQAIEEGFILDVLQNYTEYATFFQINKWMPSYPFLATYSSNALQYFTALWRTRLVSTSPNSAPCMC